MTEDLPEIFDRLQPQPAPPELRRRVLSAVGRELVRRKKPRWERAFELGVAACLALGIGLNVWQWRSHTDWQQRVYGSSIEFARAEAQADAVASSDAQVDRLIHKRLAILAPRREAQVWFSRRYEQMLKELTKAGSE